MYKSLVLYPVERGRGKKGKGEEREGKRQRERDRDPSTHAEPLWGQLSVLAYVSL